MRMDGMATNDERTLGFPPTLIEWLARTATVAVLALLGLTGLLLVARRASGALVEPLPPLTLLALGLSLAGAALLARRLLADGAPTASWRIAAWVTPSVVLLLWMLGVTLPGTNPLGLVAFSGLILLEEGWSWGRFRGGVLSMARPAVTSARELAESSISREAELSGPAAGLLVDDGPADYDEAVTQQVVRRREESGEVLTGWTRVDFAQAQRVAAAHIAICPPLASNPTCDAEQQDGPPAQLKVTQAMSYGVRLEIKLDEPAETPTSVIVEFSIQEHAAVANADE
jgi:hypothetical protein